MIQNLIVALAVLFLDTVNGRMPRGTPISKDPKHEPFTWGAWVTDDPN